MKQKIYRSNFKNSKINLSNDIKKKKKKKKRIEMLPRLKAKPKRDKFVK